MSKITANSIQDLSGNIVSVSDLNTVLGDGGSALVGYLPAGTDAVATMVQTKLRESVSVLDFGADPTGATDSTAAFNNAIAAAVAAKISLVIVQNGTYLLNAPSASGTAVTVPAGITLSGGGNFRGAYGAQIITNSGGTLIACAGSPNYFYGGGTVDGFGFRGYIAVSTTNSVGVKLNGNASAVSNCSFRFFNNAGVVCSAGSVSCLMQNLLMTSCVQNKAVSSITGALTISGTDHYIDNVQAGCGQNVGWTISSASLYVAGIAFVNASNCFVSNSSGENADIGIIIDNNSGLNRFSNCRGDNNSGHGWLINNYNGGNCMFSACLAQNNSNNSNAAYNHFQVVGYGNTFAACSISQSNANVPAYGFNDLAAASQVGNRNTYASCWSPGGYATAMFNTTGYLSSTYPVDSRPVRNSTVSATLALDATGTTFIVLVQTGATTITSMINGQPGQDLRLLGNANVTIAHGGNIYTNTGANKTLVANKIYTFTHYFGNWYENS